MPDHPNEVEAVPEPDPVVTIVVGDGRVTPGESPQDGLDVRAGLISSSFRSDGDARLSGRPGKERLGLLREFVRSNGSRHLRTQRGVVALRQLPTCQEVP